MPQSNEGESSDTSEDEFTSSEMENIMDTSASSAPAYAATPPIQG